MDEDRTSPPGAGDLRLLLHRLNNQLAAILAHAELLESKAQDDAQRTRATHIVNATLEAITVVQDIRARLNDA
jgi:hypothetical protein